MAYERDFSHIPYDLFISVLPFAHISLVYSVLNRNRRPLGYVDVAKLKKVWESGKANPVRSNFAFMLIDPRQSPLGIGG